MCASWPHGYHSAPSIVPSQLTDVASALTGMAFTEAIDECKIDDIKTVCDASSTHVSPLEAGDPVSTRGSVMRAAARLARAPTRSCCTLHTARTCTLLVHARHHARSGCRGVRRLALASRAAGGLAASAHLFCVRMPLLCAHAIACGLRVAMP